MAGGRIGGLRGWRIARVHGVDIKVHFSLIFIIIYVAVIASAQFPYVARQSGIDPGDIGGAPAVWGLILAVALFLSVLIHEFAHVLVAQAMGVKVRGITLMMLGGVSEMEKIPEQRYAEFKVAVVGPVTSLVLAGLLFLGRGVTTSADFGFFCYWLARVNLVLGIFNLLPAFPLDGGRVFRSLLAARTNPARATAISARVAEALAWILGIFGLLSFNIILILIAFFVFTAARSEALMSTSRGILKGVKVRDAWTEVLPVSESETLSDAVAEMVRTRLRALPVETSDGAPALLLAEAIKSAPREQWGFKRVRDAMIPVSRFASLDDRLDELFPELSANGALPVRDGGRIRGVITALGVAQMLETLEFEKQAPRGGKAA